MDDTTTEQDLMTMTMSSSNGGDEMSTSTSSSTNGSGTNGCGKKATITSPDPTSYVAKARVTRPTPPPPSYNPMQFVQIKPCNLYQTAQEQLKKAEEVKKLKEVKKEEPEEWQNNLDNWKSSRRKRVEHIIDRVVEVKKLELEEHDRMRRKSKTFSEMIEERAERGGPRGRAKLATLAVYNEDEANDLSDLGIGTSSASGKSSLSEDYDNNSVMSDNAAELDKAIGASENQNKNHTTSHHLQQQQQQQHEQQQQQSTTREYISSPGYDTSSSTAPASSPDPCEYTYEGAIQDYKARVTRAATGGKLPSTTGNNNSNNNGLKSKETSPENEQQQHQQNGVDVPTYPTRRGSKIEDRLIGFEVTSPSDHQEVVEKQKVDVPKIDISKRKEIFESQAIHNNGTNEPKSNGGTAAAAAAATTPTSNGGGAPRVVLRERFKFNDAANNTNGTNGNADELPAAKKEMKRLSGDITSIRDRMQSLEQQKNSVNATKIVDVPVPPLKERLSSLQNAVTKEDVKKPPVALIDARQLEIMKNEEARMKQQRQVEIGQQQQQPQQQQQLPKAAPAAPTTTNANIEVIVEAAEADRDDSGIHTSTDDIELLQKEQEQQLNEAIAALALEEKQLEEAANAVNQIEAEFAELTDLNPAPLATASPLPKLPKAPTATTTTGPAPPPIAAATTTTNENTRNMEFSINEALELALEAIDRETRTENANTNTNQQQQQIKQLKQQHNQNEKPNKTDEEKNQIQQIRNNNNKQQLQQQQQKKKNDGNEQEEIEQVDDDEDNNNEDVAAFDAVSDVNGKQQEEEEETKTQTITTSINEAIIAKEPIYENINSAISMHEVEIVVKSIPNKNKKQQQTIDNNTTSNSNNKTHNQINNNVSQSNLIDNAIIIPTTTTTTAAVVKTNKASEGSKQQEEEEEAAVTEKQQHQTTIDNEPEPYYQVPKSSEPYYDAPKHLRPIPVYENIEIFYTNGMDSATTTTTTTHAVNGTTAPLLLLNMEPPKEKPPPPPTESPPPLPCDDELDSVGGGNTDTWSSSDNTYETIATRRQTSSITSALAGEHPSPPIKRMNSTKRIKKELRNKRSSFLGIEAGMDDEESYLEMTVAPPPDMAQLLQEERRLEKQLYIKAGLCDSSDTGESRDSGVSENHSRQSSEHYTNSSEEHDPQLDTPPHSLKVSNPEIIYQNEALLTAAQTPLLQTVKGNSAESWTESATVAAAASQSLSEATATANAKMLSIEEKIREQEEVLRVERELLHFSQEELKRQRENLLLRENLARRELQHGAKMLMSANRRSLQDLHGVAGGMSLHNGTAAIGNGMLSAFQPPAAKLQLMQQQQKQQLQQQALPTLQLQQQQQQQQQQIYANLPNLQAQYYQVETDYRKSMSDLNEFSKRLMLPPTPPTKPMRAMHIATNGHHEHNIIIDQFNARQRHSLNMQNVGGVGGGVYGGSLVKIATMDASTAPTRYSNNNNNNNNNYHHYQSAQNLSQSPYHSNSNGNVSTTAPPPPLSANNNNNNGVNGQVQHGNMTRNTLHALSATPKPKYTDGWVQVHNRKTYDSNLTNDAAWITAYQQKRKSMPDYQTGYNGNHWLVQEAEQRRLMEQQQQQQQHQQAARRTLPCATQKITASNGKPLPDSIIQTLTERVQSKGIGERKRFDNNYNQMNNGGSYHANHATHRHHNGNATANNINNNNNNNNELKLTTNTQVSNANNANANAKEQEKVLSVSGKKKCSHCGDELGRGAAMIIESLLLFYHINCFKCCVCHVQLGDGLNGTDVRVRNQKLHCQNCYSSDDGIKFSCV